MQFLVETTKTKQIYASPEPKPLFFKRNRTHDDSDVRTAVVLKPNRTSETIPHH